MFFLSSGLTCIDFPLFFLGNVPVSIEMLIMSVMGVIKGDLSPLIWYE